MVSTIAANVDSTDYLFTWVKTYNRWSGNEFMDILLCEYEVIIFRSWPNITRSGTKPGKSVWDTPKDVQSAGVPDDNVYTRNQTRKYVYPN